MAHVTIPDQDSFVTYASQTGTGPFVVPFAVFEKADIVVLVDGVDVGQAGFSYTATSSTTGGFQTGTITLTSSITSKDVTIYRDINPKRTTDMGVGPQNRDALNSALDRVHAQLQDVKREFGDAALLPVGTQPGRVPTPETGKALGWSGSAWTWLSDLVSASVSTFMESALVVTTAHAFAKAVSGSLTVQTYAAARLLTALSEDVTYKVKGRAATNDGGGGFFYYDSADTTTADDGGFLCLVTANSQRLKREFVGPVHSKWGCAADGTTDETTALNTFFALANSYALYLDVGDHRFNTPLTAITPAGDGVNPNGTDIRGAGFASRLVYGGASTTPGDLMTLGALGTRREGLSLKEFAFGSITTLTGSSTGIRIIDWNNVQVDLQINVGGKLWSGLRVDGCNYVWLGRTLVSCRGVAIATNDVIEINLEQAELLPAVQNQGTACLIGGGCGGWYGGNANALLWNRGIQIDGTLARTYSGLTGTTTNASTTITGISALDWAKIATGQQISGTGIPANTLVTDKPTATTITIGNAATASATISNISVYKGNEQIFLENAVIDYSNDVNLYVDDDSYNPISKLIDMGNSWLCSAGQSNVKIVDYPSGFINADTATISYSRGGYGIESEESNIVWRLGSGVVITNNSLGGMTSNTALTIFSDAIPTGNGGNAYSENIVRRTSFGYVLEQTIADTANYSLPAVSGQLLIGNNTNGLHAIFVLGGGAVTELSDPGSVYEVSATPVDTGIAFSGGAYKIFNETGASVKYLVKIIDVRPSV